MKEKYYTCKYDRAFKEIMLKESNKDILKEEIEEITILPTERNNGNLKIRRKIYNTKMMEAEKKGLEKGIKKGIKKGIAEGEKNKSIEIAKNLKQLNISTDDIVKATGLSIEEIKNLK